MSEIILTDEPKQLYVPPSLSPQNAQMATKIYFWYNRATDHIMQGAPPQWDSMKMPGYETITCHHAAEAESWSKRLTAQDKRIAEMNDYEREMVEGPMRENLRQEIKKKLANPSPGGDERRKRLNSYMLQKALDELDKQEANAKTVRESYLHVEAFEDGK